MTLDDIIVHHCYRYKGEWVVAYEVKGQWKPKNAIARELFNVDSALEHHDIQELMQK